MSLHFSKIDNVVKDAIRQFLPVESLGKSSATSKLFQTIMCDKGPWQKIAKKLGIQPTSPDSARIEVINRFIRNSALAKHVFPSISIITTCKDRFALNEQIISNWKTLRSKYPNRWIGQVQTLIEEYNKAYKTYKVPDPSKLDAVLFLLNEGIMKYVNADTWESLFYSVNGYINVREKIFHPPGHFAIFQKLLDELPKSNLKPSQIKELSENGYPSMKAVNVHTNYPYNFMEAQLKAGWKPSIDDVCFVYTRCPLDFSGTQPASLRIKYATFLLKPQEERKQFLKSLIEQKFVLTTQEEIESEIHERIEFFLNIHFNMLPFPDKEMKIAVEHVYQYIRWPEIEASILGEIPNSKDQANRRQKVLEIIEKEEKNALAKLAESSENAKCINEFVSQLKQAVKPSSS